MWDVATAIRVDLDQFLTHFVLLLFGRRWWRTKLDGEVRRLTYLLASLFIGLVGGRGEGGGEL